MRPLHYFILLGTMAIFTAASTANSQSSRIDSLLARMTVKEKVGQMTQVDLNIVVQGGYGNMDGSLDPEKLAVAVNEHLVGSLLNVVNNAYDLETWHRLITQIQDAAMKTPNKIPVIYGIDAIHGMSYARDATLFPHNIGLAAGRNPQLARRVAEVAAAETRATGIRWNFDPVLDVAKNPLWPRFEETFGEDPIIISQMGSEMVRGYQGDDLRSPTAVGATIKHFTGYSNPRTGRDRTPASIPEVELREFDIEPYRKAIQAGAVALMVNSGEVNGIPVHASRYMLTDILRGELGFEGVIVSDWEDVNRLHTRQNVAPTLKEAVRMAVLAGIDMSMTPHDFHFATLLEELYSEDAEIAKRVDESTKRILNLKETLGLFDNPYPEPTAFENFGRPEYADLALETAVASMTLLRNENNQLPINPNQRILLAGPGADHVPSLHGSWSYTWQGSRADVYPATTKTIRQALEERLGADQVISLSKPGYDDAANYDGAALIRAAAQTDHLVLCLGEDAYAESPGSIQDLALDPRQAALVEAALSTGKPVTVVLTEGRPRLIDAFAERVGAILMAYRPGSRGAEAIVGTLLGDYNPAGRLPFTYPRKHGDFVMYHHKWTEASVEDRVGSWSDQGYNPQFPFGHGLSYTSFGYSGFSVDKTSFGPSDTLTVTVSVRNTGSTAGDEVVELYSRQMYASVVPSLRRLRTFERVHLQPGESKEIEFRLSAADLAYTVYGATRGTFERKLEPGDIHLMIGGFGFELEEPGDQPQFASRPYKNAVVVRYRNP